MHFDHITLIGVVVAFAVAAVVVRLMAQEPGGRDKPARSRVHASDENHLSTRS